MNERVGTLSRLLLPSPLSLVMAVFVCLIAPALLITLQIDSNGAFSPFDEPAHLDYIERISQGELPRQGERMLESSMRSISCNGYQGADFDHLPACDSPTGAWPTSLKWNQHEAQQPPAYYALTVPLRWLSHNALGFDDDLLATRITSIVWLIAGMMLLWAAGRVMGLAPLGLATALTILVASPWVLYLSSIVSNDVAAVPAAGLVALAGAIAYRQPRAGRWQVAALAAAGFAAAALKTTNLFAVMAVATLFAIAALAERSNAARWTPMARRWLRNSGALLVGALAATMIWTIVQDSIALIDTSDDPAFDARREGPRTIGAVLSRAVALIWPLTGDAATGTLRAFSAETIGHDIQLPFYGLLACLPFAAGVSALFVSPRRWPHALGLTSLALLCVGGVVLAVGFIWFYDQPPTSANGRYGISLAPFLLLAFVGSVVGKTAQRAVAIFALVLFLVTAGVMVS